MRNTKSLFITSKEDSHCDFIIDILNKTGRGENVIRLNTEDFVENCAVTFSEQNFKISIRDSGRTFTNEEIYSVWFRRPKDFLYKVGERKVTDFVHKQSLALLRGIYFATHDTAKWVNPLPSLHRARIKLQQLVLAKRIGFNVPRTLVTNEPAEVMAFIRSVSQVSTKSLDEPNFQADKHVYPLFNRRLKKEFIELHLNNVLGCPTLFQEYIDKKSDVRVVVIGDNIFAFEIHSQENILSVDDFRGVSPSKLRHDLINLPESLKRLIIEFMKQQNLLYSSLDFVQTYDGDFFFIENNANGQWLWLELNTGIKISEILISELLK